MPIKWKLTSAFIALVLIVVGSYVALAKDTFESDKIGYIFETQQREISTAAREFDQKVSRLAFDSRAILSGYQPETKELNESALRLFKSQDKSGQQILAIELWGSVIGTEPVRFEKTTGLWSQFPTLATGSAPPPAAGGASLQVSFVGEMGTVPTFVATLMESTETREAVRIRILFQTPGVFDSVAEGQALALAQGGETIYSRGQALDKDAIGAFLVETQASSAPVADSSTSEVTIGKRNFIVSTAPIQVAGLTMYSFVDQEVALGALGVLFTRSVVFIIFTFFATIILSLLLSNTLTRNINDLKRVAERIGQGDFNATPQFTSKDEVGVLAAAFKRMSSEIQDLIGKTAANARMESELKTAGLVQERLFPDRSTHDMGPWRLAGSAKTSTEVGGDWWYYFERGQYLYVVIADATGHGTPAALITAAARSIFSFVQTRDLELTEIAEICDEAINQCSKGEVNMTALLCKIDTQSGKIRTLSAGHEAPIKVTKDDSGEFDADFLVSKPGAILGYRTKENEPRTGWVEETFTLAPGETLVLYTDGLTGVENAEGKLLGDRRLLKSIKKAMPELDGPQALLQHITELYEGFAQGHPLPDDVTIVAVEHQALMSTNELWQERTAVHR